MKRMFLFLAVPALALAVGGCAGVTVSDGDRGLSYQNKSAVGLLLAVPGLSPEMAVVLKDISANSAQQLANWGDPKDKTVLKDYTPKNSLDLREQSQKEHTPKPWWPVALQIVMPFLLGGGLYSVLTRYFPSVFAGPVGTALQAVITGVAQVREAAKAGPVNAETIKTTLANAQQQEGVQALVDSIKAKIEAKMATKKATLPPAPRPPNPA
jgi:hypothetical protein